MIFEKDISGEWNNEAIGFSQDLVNSLYSENRYDHPAYKKLIDFLNENRECRALILKYSKEKYESWLKAQKEIDELWKKLHGQTSSY